MCHLNVSIPSTFFVFINFFSTVPSFFSSSLLPFFFLNIGENLLLKQQNAVTESILPLFFCFFWLCLIISIIYVTNSFYIRLEEEEMKEEEMNTSKELFNLWASFIRLRKKKEKKRFKNKIIKKRYIMLTLVVKQFLIVWFSHQFFFNCLIIRSSKVLIWIKLKTAAKKKTSSKTFLVFFLLLKIVYLFENENRFIPV